MMNLTTAMTIVLLTTGGQQPADNPSGPQSAAAPAAQTQPAPSRDRAVDPSQPDFTLVALPTTLRMPRFASAFRVTHRFTRSLASGDFGDLASDLFGFDTGAQIGLEYRIGILNGTQIGINRTSDRTIQFFLQHQVLRQGRSPVGIDAIANAEGTNNFRDRYTPSLGAVISRTMGKHGAVYLQPIWVNNTNPLPTEVVDDNSTFLVGFGGRFRIRPTVYLVGEAAPRLGYRPGAAHTSFAIEKRAGGHSFQINVSNGFGSTMGQVAQGGFSHDDWFIGFNISRKFF